MATLPSWSTSQQNVADIIRDKNEIYQPEGPRIPGHPTFGNKPSNATPMQMKLLLDELRAYTEEVQSNASKEGVTTDTVMGQWQSDMSHWLARLNHYYEELKKIPPEQAETLQGADAIYFTVTSPLLDGYFYEVLPGVVLNEEEKERMKGDGFAAASNKKPPDLYIPFTLGNQVLVYREHQRERWEKFWSDLQESARNLGKGVREAGEVGLPWFIGVGIFVGAVALAGGIVYLIVQHQRSKMMYAGGAPPPYMPPASGAPPAQAA